jgi:hypothetical protein
MEHALQRNVGVFVELFCVFVVAEVLDKSFELVIVGVFDKFVFANVFDSVFIEVLEVESKGIREGVCDKNEDKEKILLEYSFSIYL